MEKGIEIRQLIIELKKQEAKAQREIFDSYSDYLFRVCYRYLYQKETVEDVLSQVFFKVFTKIADTDIEDEIKLKAWMKKIAVNQCLQEIRKKSVFTESIVFYEEEQGADIDTDQDLLREDLITLVLDLPLGYRTVFILYVIEGYTHQEIAEKLQINVGTSKSQLSKARKIIKEQIIKMKLYHERIN